MKIISNKTWNEYKKLVRFFHEMVEKARQESRSELQKWYENHLNKGIEFENQNNKGRIEMRDNEIKLLKGKVADNRETITKLYKDIDALIIKRSKRN